MKQGKVIKISAPCKLTDNHKIDDFDCGNSVLNSWLGKYAMQNQKANAAITFAVCLKKNVIGYYSLAVGSVEHEIVPIRIKKGLARHPIPIMILSRLAVDIRHHGQGIGRGLVKDAIYRTLQASEYAGIRAILVHAKDENVRGFYEQFDFESSPMDPLILMLLLKDARKTLESL